MRDAKGRPLCEWHAGCDQPQCTWDNLCAFHFDACERPEHAAAQSEWEHRSCTADCCADEEQAA